MNGNSSKFLVLLPYYALMYLFVNVLEIAMMTGEPMHTASKEGKVLHAPVTLISEVLITLIVSYIQPVTQQCISSCSNSISVIEVATSIKGTYATAQCKVSLTSIHIVCE